MNGGRVGRGAGAEVGAISVEQHPPSSETLSLDAADSPSRTKRAATRASDLLCVSVEVPSQARDCPPVFPVLVHHSSHRRHASLKDSQDKEANARASNCTRRLRNPVLEEQRVARRKVQVGDHRHASCPIGRPSMDVLSRGNRRQHNKYRKRIHRRRHGRQATEVVGGEGRIQTFRAKARAFQNAQARGLRTHLGRVE